MLDLSRRVSAYTVHDLVNYCLVTILRRVKFAVLWRIMCEWNTKSDVSVCFLLVYYAMVIVVDTNCGDKSKYTGYN